MNSSRGGTIDELEVRAIISIYINDFFKLLTWKDGSSWEAYGKVTDGEDIDHGGLTSGREADCQTYVQVVQVWYSPQTSDLGG